MAKPISYSFSKWEKRREKGKKATIMPYLLQDIEEMSTNFLSANAVTHAYWMIGSSYHSLAENLYEKTEDLEQVLHCLNLLGGCSYRIVHLLHQFPQLETRGSWRSLNLEAPLCLAGRWEEAATAIKLRNDRYKTRINSGNVSKEEYERYFKWDTITCLMIEQDFIQALQAIQKFRAEGKDNIRDRTDFFEGIISGDFDEVTAVARLYLTAYEAIINRDEKLLNDSVQKLLKHYRTQTSVDTLNLGVLMLEKIAVHAGLNIDVDVVEAPKTLLYLTLDHNKSFDIPQTDFPLEETVKRLVEQGSVATKPAVTTPPIVVEKSVVAQPAAPASPAQSSHADPVLAAMNQIDQKEQSLSLSQKSSGAC